MADSGTGANNTAPASRERYGGQAASSIKHRSDRTTPFSISVEGLEGTGKSFFGLTSCPLPIVHVNFGDRDATPIIDQLDDDRAAAVTTYNFYPKSAEGWTRQEGAD